MNSQSNEVENVPRPLLRPEVVARLLDVTEGTLAVWRTTRRYPLRWVKVGRVIRYRMEDVQSFIALRTNEGDDISKAGYRTPEDRAKRPGPASRPRPRPRRARRS